MHSYIDIHHFAPIPSYKLLEYLPSKYKARLNFEQLTGEKFQMDHFSDHLSIVQKS